MNSQNLVINCNSCDSWFSEDEVNWKFLREECTCPRCGGQVRHAHEYNLQTPWQAIRAEIIKEEIRFLKQRIAELENVLVDECWEE
jgi:uncharacterized paraquat-inducible protein A